LKPGPARRIDLEPGPADSGLELDQVEEKIEKVMTRCDSAEPAG